MMDTLETTVILLSGMLLVMAAFAFAKWQDPFWRCKTLRNFKKKDYIIAGMINENKTSIKRIIVDAQQSCFMYEGGIYVIDKTKIKRDREIKTLLNGPASSITAQSSFREEKIMFVEGCPIAFFDKENLMPVGFVPNDKVVSGVTPAQAGATIMAWYRNMIARGAMDAKMVTLLLIGVLLLGLLNLGASGYYVKGGIDTCDAKITEVHNELVSSGLLNLTQVQKPTSKLVVVNASSIGQPGISPG